MDYHIRRVSRETAGRLVPARVFELTGMENPLAAVAAEGKMLTGIVLLSEMNFGNKETEILSMQIDPDFEGMGLEENMLELLAQHAGAAGMNAVKICLPEGEESREAEEKLLAAGFSGSTEFAKRIGYRLPDLKASRLMDRLDRMKPFLDHVRSAGQLAEETARGFEKEMNQTGRRFDRNLADPLYGQFYVEDERIDAFMDFHAAEEEHLICRMHSYARNPGKSPYITAAMLASFLCAENAEQDEDWEVDLAVSREAEYKDLLSIFGKPAIDRNMMTYRRKL